MLFRSLPSFQGNNAISTASHVKNFNVCIFKWCNVANYENVKMRLFVLSLEEDALDSFTEQPANSYDSLQAIVNSFMGKYRERRENSHLISAISTMKKNENETMEEFNKRFNELVKSMPTTAKPAWGLASTHRGLSSTCIHGCLYLGLRNLEVAPHTPLPLSNHAEKRSSHPSDGDSILAWQQGQ